MTATFPQGSGEMTRRIREHDWSRTPLGPIEGWTPSQKAIVELVLASGHAMQLAWGPERTVLYNDAYAPMLGARHPSALGMPFHEAWPDIWNDIEPLVARVFAGETVRFEDFPLSMTRNGYAEDTWWNFSYSPVRDESSRVVALLNVTVDATPHHRAQQAERERDDAARYLRETDERQAFLLKLSNALRFKSDAVDIQRTTVRLLAEGLDVMRATYFEVAEDGNGFWLTARHERNAAPVPERMQLSDFGPEIAAAYRAGRTVVFCDTETETHLGSAPEMYRHLGIRAWIAVPLVKDQRLIAVVGVNSAKARDWTSSEVQLVEEVADRAWSATERSRVEASLRESEERYRALFERMGQAYALCEVLRNAEGKIVDHKILEANPVCLEALGSSKEVLGRPVREWFPAFEDWWLEKFERVISSGTEQRVEHGGGDGRWFRTYLYPASGDRFYSLFEEITDGKRAPIG